MKILVPIEADQNSEKIIEATIKLNTALKNSADIILLHVVNSDIIPEDIEIGTNIKEELAEEGSHLLKAELKKFKEAEITVTVFTVFGFPAKEIIRFSKNNHINYIIMGHHNLSMLSKITVGSVALKVIHYASCPVLVVK